MSASVLRGMLSAPKAQDWMSSALLLAPSAIMYEMCVVLRTAVPANLVFHAFMVSVILAHGWSLRVPANALRHREGSLAGQRAYNEAADGSTRRFAERAAFWVMFAVGLLAYAVCRAVSLPDEYIGVDKPELRRTLDAFGVRTVCPMLAFAVYFSVVNAHVEEIFWRQLLRWRLRLRATQHVGRRKPSDAARVDSACRHADALSAVAYSAYHSVIIANLMPPWFNLGVAFPFLAFMGQLLNRVADHPKLGVGVCVALHTGLDAATAFWVLDIRFGWLDFIFP